jgi:hypothetical protein
MAQGALREWDPHQLDFMFIENVGNLVCPSSYDLGETLRLVLMSVTEGEDKLLKFPTIFNSADEHSVGAARDAHLPSLSQDWGGDGRVRKFSVAATRPAKDCGA